ncbi:hypothetical protein PVAP13_1KG071500 [Panicum virgatum]|uniref:Uncharacterized protein n=1 Tax=Panicum virgatum TaxID=38727 RepID=A0A8T0XG58_PANVG|nr:hypothetical protein PVAP13_1KG071500 [Panicum virgatum]
MLAVFKLTTENITTLTSSGIHGTKRAATSSSSCSGRDAYNLLNVLLQQRHGATRHDAELKPGRELQRRRRPRAGAKPEIDADAASRGTTPKPRTASTRSPRHHGPASSHHGPALFHASL